MSVKSVQQEAPKGRLNVSKERFKKGEGEAIARLYFASKAAVRLNAGEVCHCPPKYSCELCIGDPRPFLTPENILAALEPLMRAVDEAHIDANDAKSRATAGHEYFVADMLMTGHEGRCPHFQSDEECKECDRLTARRSKAWKRMMDLYKASSAALSPSPAKPADPPAEEADHA